jgi:hypothetical protein
MSKLLTLVLALAAAGSQAGPALAQAGGSGSFSSAQPGSFDREYPEAAEILNSFSAARATLLEQLHTAPGASIEQATYPRLLAAVTSGSNQPTAMRGSMTSLARLAPEVAEALAWGFDFERALYDIFADGRITERTAAVDEAVNRYLSRTDIALAAEPKFMMAGGGHDHMEMADGHHSMMFQGSFPNANGLIWATQWLEIALFDPLLFYSTEEERDAGIATVVQRYRELVSEAPDNFPTQMPTPPAVAPELVRLHPEAAAIIDNVHKLYGAVADALVHQQTGDKSGVLEAALLDMQDPEHMAVTEYDWILNSLRNGIFFQGGPAIGRLETSERNRNAHGIHANMVLPGMGGPSGAGMPAAPETLDGSGPPPADPGTEQSND